jgi:polyvinyl alcohol dehydrogenase (cytochrome)
MALFSCVFRQKFSHLRGRSRLAPLIAGAIAAFAFGPAAAQSASVPQNDQERVFQDVCAVCHANLATRAPTRESLSAMSPDFIVKALTDGVMQQQGSALSPAQRAALAEFLTGQKIGAAPPMTGRCSGTHVFSLDGPSFNGWGANPQNWRYQAAPDLGAEQLPRLEVKWAFGVPGVAAMFGQPTIAGGRVFIGAQNGHVYALDAASGCLFWDFSAETSVRSAITAAHVKDRDLAFFGDRRGHAYALDAATGELVWKVAAAEGPAMEITGAPALFEGRLYVPISGGDDSAAVDPNYECCKGRGAVVALDAASGATIWRTYTIPEARPQGRNSVGAQLWGPSGASIWSSPTIDAEERALYVGTGDNHSAPPTDTSAAVLALSLDTGEILWSSQLLPGDMGDVACLAVDRTNCPEPHGPDFDFGSSPNLITLDDGRRLLAIGQKSGVVHALDPDDRGRIVWQTRVGLGGPLGGVQWGTATDGATIYAATSDVAFKDLVTGQPFELDPDRGGGLHALAADTGAVLWAAPPARACGERKNCSPAQSAAVTATLDFVLSGAIDGHIRAYAVEDGRVLWDYDTARPFATVNGVKARGGSIDAAGPTVAGGMIFVNSGYGLYGGNAGNVLLAFAPRP